MAFPQHNSLKKKKNGSRTLTACSSVSNLALLVDMALGQRNLGYQRGHAPPQRSLVNYAKVPLLNARVPFCIIVLLPKFTMQDKTQNDICYQCFLRE